MALAPGDRLGPYEILAPIGAGGMGEVYRAHDSTLEREVAVKVLPRALANDPERLARFDREAKILAGLNHPNIAIIHGLAESDGQRALVMELVEGETLAAVVKRGPMSLRNACTVACQIAEALEAAHDKGVVHRDLKPGNVMATPTGLVKVLDFGLAAMVQPTPATPGNSYNSPTLTMGGTMAGTILGTASYMSPEQAEGLPVDKRADIWSYGVVLWEMLTGTRLFDGQSVSRTLADVLRMEIDFGKLPRETPASIRNLLRRCLDRDVKTRLRDAGEARVAIQRYLADPGGGTEVVPQAEVRPKPRWPWAVAAVLALVVGATSAWFAKPSPPQPLLQMEMALPEGVSLTPLGPGWSAFSPAGDRLVFAGVGKDGRRSLWLRNLEADSAVVLPGTQNAQAPFWSPDGRWVAFFADGKLQKVDTSGGTAVVICQTDGVEGTWNRDGVILLGSASGAGQTRRSVQQVSASGGTPKPVFAVDASRGETGHSSPYFLPDGRHFLYISYSQGRDAMLGSLDGKTRRVLFTQGSSPVFYTPDPSLGESQTRGWLLYVNQRQLFARPFDAEKGELTGEGALVADSVLNGPSWAASSKGLLLVRHNQGARSQLTWFNRNGKSLGTAGDPGDIAEPRISPDQKTIAYSKDQIVWLHDIARAVATKLVSERSSRPIWSLDGRSIVYDTVRDGKRFAVERPINSVGEKVLFQGKSPAAGGVLSLSQDGRWIAMMDAPRIFFVSRMQANTVPFLDRGRGAAEFSPDGRWLVYPDSSSGRQEIFVQAIPKEAGGVAEAEGARFQISSEGGSQPHWSHDGKEIFYVRDDLRMISVPVESGERFVRPLTPKVLFETRLTGTGWAAYDVTPDGQRFLIPQPLESTSDRLITVIVNWPKVLRR